MSKTDLNRSVSRWWSFRSWSAGFWRHEL